MDGRVVLALLSLLSAAASAGEPRPFCQQTPPDDRMASPVGVIAYFELKALPALMKAASHHPELTDRPLYVGSFGPNPEAFQQVRALPKGCYAPILHVPFYRKHYAVREHVLPEEAAKLPASEAAYAGPFPERLMDVGDPDVVRRWGLELGRRMRDYMRAVERGANGVVYDAWQLNELGPTTFKDTPNGAVWRYFLSGVLHGVAFGRPELGDAPRRGIVFVSGPRRMAVMDPSWPGVEPLLRSVRQASLRIAGEEYVKFVGNPRRMADWIDKRQKPFPKWVRRRYLPLLTPGYAPWKVWESSTTPTYTWGNVDDCSDLYVDRWRNAFVKRRVRPAGEDARTAGLGMWAFVGPNTEPHVLQSAIFSVARGIGAILGRKEPQTASSMPPCRPDRPMHAGD